MRTFDFTPYYRSTVGFDLAIRPAGQEHQVPYNIKKKGEDQYRITMTVAGFAPAEIELVQHEARSW
jgi:molecular chaperone IbpA